MVERNGSTTNFNDLELKKNEFRAKYKHGLKETPVLLKAKPPPHSKNRDIRGIFEAKKRILYAYIYNFLKAVYVSKDISYK